MTPPLYVMNPPPSSPFPLVESSKEDHHQVLLQLPFAPQQQQLPAAASSDLSFYISLTYSNQQDQRGTISTNPAELQVYDHEHKTEKCSYPNHHGGSSSTDQLQAFSSSSTDPLPHMNVNDGDHSKDRYDQNGSADIDHSSNGSKWMSSKMRLMQKIKNNSNSKPAARIVQGSQQKDNNISNGQKINSPNNSSSSSSTTTTTRVCSDCHTTKTPLWRSGPQGPKSLCNACGIRQRKARRAAMAAAAAAEGAVHAGDRILSMPVVTNKLKVVQKKEKRSSRKRNNERFKKQIHCRGSKELVFDNFALSLSKNSAFRRVFPRDEEEAAVLLMALSCGLA